MRGRKNSSDARLWWTLPHCDPIATSTIIIFQSINFPTLHFFPLIFPHYLYDLFIMLCRHICVEKTATKTLTRIGRIYFANNNMSWASFLFSVAHEIFRCWADWHVYGAVSKVGVYEMCTRTNANGHRSRLKLEQIVQLFSHKTHTRFYLRIFWEWPQTEIILLRIQWETCVWLLGFSRHSMRLAKKFDIR